MFPKKILYPHYQILRFAFSRYKSNEARENKSGLRVYHELLKWYIRRGEINTNYLSWGLHLKERSPDDYIGRNEFLKIKHRAEKRLLTANLVKDLCYDVLTKDKFVCGSYLSANGIPCIPHHGFVTQGKYHHLGLNKLSLEKLIRRERELFIKNVSLEASEGICFFEAVEDILYLNEAPVDAKSLLKQFKQGVWIVQGRIISHQLIRKMNDSALNTTRIVTIINGDKPEYLSGFQAFATGQAKTDAWSKGSVYVGLDLDGKCLKEVGYRDLSGSEGSILSAHPDSGIAFKGFTIPFLREAVDLCLKAHQIFYNSFVIGWDVAITDGGPLIVEANEKPGMNAVQCVDGGLRKKILGCQEKLIATTKEDR